MWKLIFLQSAGVCVGLLYGANSVWHRPDMVQVIGVLSCVWLPFCASQIIVYHRSK